MKTESVRISKPLLMSIRALAEKYNRTVRAEMEVLIEMGFEMVSDKDKGKRKS